MTEREIVEAVRRPATATHLFGSAVRAPGRPNRDPKRRDALGRVAEERQVWLEHVVGKAVASEPGLPRQDRE